MEVILTDGYGIDLSIKAVRMYLKRIGIDAWLYAWPEEEGYDDSVRICVRIDDVNDFPDGYEPPYDIVLADLGKEAPLSLVRENLAKKEYGLFSITDKDLIDVLRELKSEASLHGKFRIATIPDNIEWHIEGDSEYGTEWVQEGKSYPQRWYGEPI